MAPVFGLVALVLLSLVLVRGPRRLIMRDLGAAHPVRWEIGLAVILLAVGCGLFSVVGGDIARRIALGALGMTLFAVIYYDVRFFVIPDLFSLILAALAVLGPLALPWREGAIGAVLCGGLLGVVAWVWRWRTGAEGLGLGDVKLAAALGALTGLEPGLWMVSGAAFSGAVFGFIGQTIHRKRRPAEPTPLLIPFGAALATVGGGLILWAHR